MRIYWNLLLLQLKTQMQYRTSFFLALFGQFLASFSMVFGLYFVLAKVDAMDEFTYGQVLICFAVIMMSFSIGEFFGGGFAVLSSLIGSGELDRVLIRPRNLLLQIMFPHIDFTRLGLFIQSLVVMIYAIPRSDIVWTWERKITLCLMVICGGIIFFGLFLIQACFSFFTIQSVEFMNLFTYGARTFGRYPYSVYGTVILKILTFVVPLALFQYYPLLYLTGREESWLYMFLPVVALVFLVPCYGLFRFGLNHYQSTGS